MTHVYLNQGIKVESSLENEELGEVTALEKTNRWAKLRQAKRTRNAAKTKADGKSSVSKTLTLIGH